ncbi:MAG: right-handed parallel beta-helix repeat-containing protein [Candidatus Hodarchaeota archaeon]
MRIKIGLFLVLTVLLGIFWVGFQPQSYVLSESLTHDQITMPSERTFQFRSKSQAYTPHGPISISDDYDLANEAVNGSGTSEDPYILEGWNITTSGVNGIFIQHTTKHFIIRNCWIDTGNTNPGGYSIRSIGLSFVAAGTATISNNTCLNSVNSGIYLYHSNSTVITNNICRNNGQHGIYFFYSHFGIAANNTCSQNPING